MKNRKVPTPREIIAHLDRYVISQADAKETIAIAVSNHFALQGSEHYTPEGAVVDKFSKPNILVIGPTGSGKTLAFESLSRADTLDVPFAIVDTKKCTESGYSGEKVENALIRLWIAADYDLERAQRGIVYFDEFDKIARKGDNATHRDVSGEGVQYELLAVFGGMKMRLSTKGTGNPNPEVEYIDFDTSKVQFACGGAFPGLERIIERRLLGQSTIGFGGNPVTREEDEKKAYEYLLQVEDEDLIQFGLIAELVGRLTYRTAVQPLSVHDFRRILTEPRNCLTDQYKALLRKKNVMLTFTDDAITAMSEQACEKKTGARSLQRIVQEVLKATDLVLPPRKVITQDDVVNWRQKLIEARRQLRSTTVRSEPASLELPASIVTVFAEANPGQKEIVCLGLPVPSAMWEEYKDGDDNSHTRLMKTADNRRFYVIRRVFCGTHSHGNCGHKTENMSCEWVVPYRQGVHPLELTGYQVPVQWVCGGCKETVTGSTLYLGEPRWNDGIAKDSVILAKSKSAHKQNSGR